MLIVASNVDGSTAAVVCTLSVPKSCALSCIISCLLLYQLGHHFGWVGLLASRHDSSHAAGYRSVSHYLVLTKQASALDKPVSQQKAQPKPCGNETMTECPPDAQPQASAGTILLSVSCPCCAV